MGRKDITQLEIRRLPEVFNLTDGHAHRTPLNGEESIVEALPQKFATADRERQQDFERDYLDAFYGLTGQTIDEDATKYMFLPAASFSLEIVANYLRMRGLSLALTEPCFDNLVNIFRRHDIALEPIPDEWLESSEWGDLVQTLESDAICVVSPNNPTGISYTRDNFEKLVRYCKENGKLLIVDSSFRPYRPMEESFDEYAMVQRSGVDYMFIEDSGKTWPARELKVSILATSASIFRPVYDIYTDLMYHQSPLTLSVVAEFIRHSIADGLQTVHGVVRTNRLVLEKALEGSCLELVSKPYASVAWLRIRGSVTAQELQALLARGGIHVLEGNYFYWTDSSKGDKLIRIALLRDRDIFAAAASRIRAILAAIPSPYVLMQPSSRVRTSGVSYVHSRH